VRIAVTGATGFLGGHLVSRLLRDGHSVTAIARDRQRAARLEAQGVKVLFGDLTAAVEPADGEPVDAFVHAAALSSNWGRREAFVAANVTATQTAVDLAKRLEAQRFVLISSPSIYFRFADQISVGEDVMLPPPVNAYAETKRAAEAIVLAAPELNPLILRPRGIYGRGDVALLPRLVRAARSGPLPLLRDGTAVTDLTHVDDVVSAIVAAIEGPAPGKACALNVSSGEAVPIVTIIEKACAIAGVRPRWRRLPTWLALGGAGLAEAVNTVVPGRPEPIATRYSLGVLAYSQTLDISRAASTIGWRPSIALDEGLRRL
jgi:nucleoside-diphosphate-sugar epimerase